MGIPRKDLIRTCWMNRIYLFMLRQSSTYKRDWTGGFVRLILCGLGHKRWRLRVKEHLTLGDGTPRFAWRDDSFQ